MLLIALKESNSKEVVGFAKAYSFLLVGTAHSMLVQHKKV